MVDTVKISDLNGLTSVSAEDLFVVVDKTGPTTNSITRANLVSSLGTQLIRSDVDASFSGTKTGSGMLELTNTSAQSTSISALWLSGSTGALMMDNLGQKRIFWNDGGGAFGLRSGHYYSGGEKYITSGDGASEIEINTDTTNGTISFRTAQTGNSGDIVSWDNEILMSVRQTQFGQRIIPSTDKTLDLGFSSRYWNNFYTANAFISGNIGIGTTSPLSNFHVVGANQTTAALDDGGSQDGLLRISGTGTTGGTGGGIIFSSTQGDSAGSVGMAAIKSLLFAGTANTTGHIAFSTRANTSDPSLTERMRITAQGLLGIGNTSPTATLEVEGDIRNRNTISLIPSTPSTTTAITIGAERTGDGYSYIDFVGDNTYSDFGLRIIRNNTGANATSIIQHRGTGDFSVNTTEESNIVFRTNSIVSLLLQSDQTVGIQEKIYHLGDENTSIQFPSEDTFAIETGGSERLRVDAQGDIGIGTSSPIHPLHIFRDGATFLAVQSNTTSAASLLLGDTDVLAAGRIQYANIVDAMQIFTNSNEAVRISSVGNMGVGDTSPSERLSVNGNLTVSGSVSKGSGSFKISHPLPEMADTHHLVHSFIEGPQADLIYRGKTKLVNGIAEINIDEVAKMTEGTFEILCREVQCFTSNETGWTPVRGYVVGNLLKIESQTQCDDEVSWLVIGERQDPVIYESSLTDDFGKIIVEPLKPVIEEDNEPQLFHNIE